MFQPRIPPNAQAASPDARKKKSGIEKETGQQWGWSSSCFISPLLEPLQLPQPGPAAGGGWQVGRGGCPSEDRVALLGVVLLLEEAAAQGRQEKAGQGQLTRGWASLLEEGVNREGGAARADQGLFSQLAFAFTFVPSMYTFTEVAQGLLLFQYFNK